MPTIQTSELPARYARRIGKDLAVGALGLATSVATAYLLALINTSLSWLNIRVVSFVLSGGLASSGYYFGFQLVPHRPTRLLKAAAIILSAATYFIARYFEYSMVNVHGRHLSDLISYGSYLSIAIKQLGNGNNGPLNYFLEALQFLAFPTLGWMVIGYLESIPCCSLCDKKLIPTTRASLSSNSLLQLEEVFQGVKTALLERSSAEGLQLMSRAGATTEDGVHKLVFTLWKCGHCSVEFFRLFITPGGEHVGEARGYCPSSQRTVT